MASGENISLTFADGETMTFPALPSCSVLVSAEKAGNTLAHNCRQGTCRTCAARAPDGSEVLLCTEPAQPGFVASLTYRRADLSLPTLRRAKINSFARVSRSVWEVRFRLQFPLAFIPGQFVEATFPGLDGPRRFSMANAPDEKEQILHVRDIQGGGMSEYLGERARPEDLFTVRGPFGVFYLRATVKPKLFIAGGTGLAPILSMLRSIIPETSPPLALVAGFASDEDAYAIEELRDLAGKLPLEIILAAERGSGTWSGLRANAVDALGGLRTLTPVAGIEAYLCGPPGMVSAAKEALRVGGIAKEGIFSEQFIHVDKK